MADPHDDFNIEAYGIMAEILVTVRRIVHRGLEKAAGKTWYLDGCPPGVYERLVARKENEVAIDRFDREYQELISFASLDDLAEIVEYNEELAHLLEGIAPENETMAERFRQLETLRIKLDATVPFAEEDLEKLTSFHQDFKQSLAKPKKKPEKETEATEPTPEPFEVETPPAAEAIEAAEEFGARNSDVDELGSEDIVSDEPSDAFETAVVDSGVIEGPEARGVQGESVIEVERAMANEDDGDVLRVLHREIMTVAEHVLKGDVDQEFPVWQTLRTSGWYDRKLDALALAPIEFFYAVVEEARSKHRDGKSKQEVEEYIQDAKVSKLLLALGETFKRHNL
jgi:hypothetical protein